MINCQSITPQLSTYLLNDETFKELKKEVAQGKLTRFLYLLQTLALEKVNHFLLKDCPALSFRCFKLAVKQYKSGQLEKSLVDRIMNIFRESQVFEKAIHKQSVQVRCRDGEVRFNKMLLCHYSDYFNKMLNGSMREAQRQQKNYVVDLSSYSEETLRVFQDYIYKDEKCLFDRGLQVIAELYDFARMIQDKRVLNMCHRELMKQSLEYTSDANFEEFLKTAESLQLEEATRELLLLNKLQAFCVKRKLAFEHAKKYFIADARLLGFLLHNHVFREITHTQLKGIAFSNPCDIDTLACLLFLPETIRNNITQITIPFDLYEQVVVQQFAEYFPNVQGISVTIKSVHLVETLFKKFGNVLVFPKIETFEIKMVESSNSPAIINFCEASYELWPKLPELIFDHSIVICPLPSKRQSGHKLDTFKNFLIEISLFQNFTVECIAEQKKLAEAYFILKQSNSP